MHYHDIETDTDLDINRDITSWLKGKDGYNTETASKATINDYRSGVISLDDLSCILGHFYDKLLDKVDYSSELMHVLEVGSELSYLERFSDSFTNELKIVLAFS